MSSQGPMGNAGQEDEKGGLTPSQIGILQLNNLTYKLEPDLAVVVQRNTQSSFFLSQSYAAGATMTAIVNCGSAFVNLRQSSLILDVKNDSTQYAWFGIHGGSACNFINRIQIIAKNGVVLERIDNANQLAACKVNYQYPQSWLDSVGSLMGITGDVDGTGLGSFGVGWATGTTIRFVIPLYVFSTLCDSMGSLCPAQLLAGARFEILLESGASALISATSAAAANNTLSYSITQCRLELESYLLTDSVMKVINQTAATQGLEVIAATTQDTQSQRLSNQINVDVAKSCSRALNLVYKERISPGADAVINGYGSGALNDPMASAAIYGSNAAGTYTNLPSEWQVRAGQLYFPQSSIRSASVQINQADVELFMQTLRSFQKFNTGSMGTNAAANTSLKEFRGRLYAGTSAASGPGAIVVGAQMLAGGNSCFALDLQRSAILTSGIPLSNAHQLSINYKTNAVAATGAASNTNYLVDVYLTYQVCIRTFLSQCVLEV